MYALYIAASAASLASLVGAHGYLTHISTGSGVDFQTWRPFDDPYASPVSLKSTRKFASDGPVKDVGSKAIVCGDNKGADDVPVQTVQKGIKAGESMTFHWNQWLSDHKGPVMTYMASCEGDCTKFDGSTGSPWFKIDHAGFENGQWASDKVIADGATWTVEIPASLAPGQYLVRHELLALHGASQPGGAQFYPSCNQIDVSSSGTAKPNGLSFPGAYSATDSGVLVNVWNGDMNSYKIPGGPVWDGASSGSGDAPHLAPASSKAATSSLTAPSKVATTTQVQNSARPAPSDQAGNKGDAPAQSRTSSATARQPQPTGDGSSGSDGGNDGGNGASGGQFAGPDGDDGSWHPGKYPGDSADDGSYHPDANGWRRHRRSMNPTHKTGFEIRKRHVA